jgi:hypothetical protein
MTCENPSRAPYRTQPSLRLDVIITVPGRPSHLLRVRECSVSHSRLRTRARASQRMGIRPTSVKRGEGPRKPRPIFGILRPLIPIPNIAKRSNPLPVVAFDDPKHVIPGQSVIQSP